MRTNPEPKTESTFTPIAIHRVDPDTAAEALAAADACALELDKAWAVRDAASESVNTAYAEAVKARKENRP